MNLQKCASGRSADGNVDRFTEYIVKTDDRVRCQTIPLRDVAGFRQYPQLTERLAQVVLVKRLFQECQRAQCKHAAHRFFLNVSGDHDDLRRQAFGA